MWHALEQYILANRTLIALGAAWGFSAIVSTMPPLPTNAGYWSTWVHNLLQTVAANLNRVRTPTTVVTPAIPPKEGV